MGTSEQKLFVVSEKYLLSSSIFPNSVGIVKDRELEVKKKSESRCGFRVVRGVGAGVCMFVAVVVAVVVVVVVAVVAVMAAAAAVVVVAAVAVAAGQRA